MADNKPDADGHIASSLKTGGMKRAAKLARKELRKKGYSEEQIEQLMRRATARYSDHL